MNNAPEYTERTDNIATISSSLSFSLLTLLPPLDLVVVDKIATSVALGSPLDEAIYTTLMTTTMLMLITVDLIELN
jgi:hypothetical protein